MDALLLILATAGAGFAQPGLLDDLGPLLRVPSAETGLFFHDQPIVSEGKILAPQAAIDRWLNVSAQKLSGNEIVYSYSGGTATPVEIHMWVGEKRARIARAEVPLEIAPQIVDGRLYLPLKFMADAVGVWVEHHGRQIHLRKPDLDWACWLAIPPHPKSLEGKMTALAVARRPGKPKRVESVALAADTMSGQVLIAEPSVDGKSTVRYFVDYQRDRAGWHFVAEAAPREPEPQGD